MHRNGAPPHHVYGIRRLLYNHLLAIYDVDTLLHLLYATAREIVDYGFYLSVDILDTGRIVAQHLYPAAVLNTINRNDDVSFTHTY